MTRFSQLVTAAVSCALLTPLIPATATPLSLSPAVTSNTYSGVLTLQTSGLTNGEKVVIERYLDVNANGVIDASDPLVDTFSIRDGGVSTIGGVTNVNVPFDSNPSAGALTTTLSFAPPIEAIIGQQIVRLVSPYGNFVPQTNLLTITNANFGQSVSGAITAGGAAVPYAMAVVLSMPNFNFVAGVFSDASGHYSVKLPAGSYAVMPTFPNYFTDQSLAAMVTLTNGASATANVFLTNGSPTYTVSGQITDATNGLPLGGVFVQLQSGNLFAIAFTDANGNYSAALAPSFWKIKLESSRLARRAYVSPQDKIQVDATAGSVANVNISLPKANALFYGRITDNSSVPFPNIDFYAQDDSQQFKADGYSDANGNYAAAVFAPGTNQWNCGVSSGDNNSQLQNYLITFGLGTTPISPGQAIRQDFTVMPATSTISGRVQDNGGNPISNIGLYGNANIGGISYNSSATTDDSGNYSMPAGSGNWNLSVNCCGDKGLDSHGLSDPLTHSVSIPPNNAVLNITVYPAGTPFLTGGMRLSSSQFAFDLNGSPGANYTVQASTDLVNWSSLFSLNLTSNWMSVQDNSATGARKFYRVKKN